MAVIHPLLTYDDLVDLPDDGRRYELLEGELAVSPAPARGHQKAAGRIYAELLRAEDAGWGEVYVAPFEVYFDEQNAVQPDVLFVRRERLQIVTEARVEGPPDLVVEVLSPSTRRRDIRVKMQIYARFGVPYYWLVDAGARTVQPYELTAERYTAQPLLHPGDTLSCPLFPGIALDVATLFR